MEEEGAGQIGDWDDFAIQRSWNSAVAEYEKYHSIAKSGKPLEEALTKEEHEALLEAGRLTAKFLGLPTENETTEDDESIDEETGSVAMKEEGDLDEDGDELAVISRAEAEHVGKPQTTRPSQMQQATNDVSATAANFNEPVVDQAMSHDNLASPTYDEVIENMVQSQYWAGYYRGYYDAMKKLRKDSEG